jgi:hypothetical protein
MTKSKAAELEETVDASLAVLRKDPPRLKKLLRNVAELADEVAGVLDDAEQKDAAERVRTVGKLLRGAAVLPAALAVPLLRKSLAKLVASAT